METTDKFEENYYNMMKLEEEYARMIFMREHAEDREEPTEMTEEQLRSRILWVSASRNMYKARRDEKLMRSRGIDLAMHSSNHQVRLDAALCSDFEPTHSQIEKGLTDAYWLVRARWLCRSDITLDREQFERAVSDSNRDVRALAAQRMDITPTPEQFERGLNDRYENVRYSWSSRSDFTPTLEQIERGFEQDIIQDIWVVKYKEYMSMFLGADEEHAAYSL